MFKRTIPLILASATGFVLIVASFVPYAQTAEKYALDWFIILAAFAFILGGGSLLSQHLRKISDQRPGWGYSLVTVVSFFATLVVGLGKFGVVPPVQFPDKVWAGDYKEAGSGFAWFFNYLYTPLAATMFSILACFVASAAFRAFRAKNVEATVLLATAFIVLLGRTHAAIWIGDQGDWLVSQVLDPAIWHPYATGLRLDKLTETIMDVFNTAGTRAIMIGIALGIVSTSLKVLLGVDRSYLGSDEG